MIELKYYDWENIVHILNNKKISSNNELFDKLGKDFWNSLYKLNNKFITIKKGLK